MRCHIDIETFSEANLIRAGVYSYAVHPSTDIHCIVYAIDNHAPRLWVTRSDIIEEAQATHESLDWQCWRDKCPGDLKDILLDPDIELCAWNAMFERVVLNSPVAFKHNIPETPIHRWHCTMAKGASSGLPQKLEKAALAFGTHEKNEAGHGEMLQLAKPRKPSKLDSSPRWDMDNYPDKYQRLYNYCVDDVLAERELDAGLPDLSDYEQIVYCMDQEINDRGVSVDLEFNDAAIKLHEARKQQIASKIISLTGHKAGSTEALRQWVEEHGTFMPNMLATTIDDTLKQPISDEVLTVLAGYTAHNMKAPAKYKAAKEATDQHYRLRGMFRYHGARTKRWSSYIVQLHNLKRPAPGINSDEVIDFILTGCDPDFLHMMFDMEPIKLLGSCIRGLLISKAGHKLVVRDFAQIEARILAWLAGHVELLKVFAAGEDVYRFAAAPIYNKSVEDVTDEERFVGKVATLALGYQGGAGAFESMAHTLGVKISYDKAEEIKTMWRQANMPIKRLWKAIENAAKHAVANPGDITVVSKGKIKFRMWRRWLLMELPSKQQIRYYRPTLHATGDLTYQAPDGRMTGLYGGLLVQNANEGIARDLLVHAMLQLREISLPIVLHAHDEVAVEVPERMAEETYEAMGLLFKQIPEWAEGLPVSSDGFIAKRYRK